VTSIAAVLVSKLINIELLRMTLGEAAKQEDAPTIAPAVLQAPESPTITRVCEALSGEPVAESQETREMRQPGLIWEGSTWDACPFFCMCLAPVRC
jgi:hypothetical protein